MKNTFNLALDVTKRKIVSPTRKSHGKLTNNPFKRLGELSSKLQKRDALNNIINSLKIPEAPPSSNIIKTALRSHKAKIVDPSPTRHSISINVIENNEDATKRRRKTTEQLAALREAYRKYPQWNKPAVHRVAKQTGLSIPQVYKWGWDQRRKQGDEHET